MGFLEDRDLTNVPTVKEFFKGKSIFITGGSGFMGKVLVEKLLYSCSDLDRIYVFLRSKKGANPNERLNNLYQTPCFDRLRNERPGIFESKVSVIAGDIAQPGLGLSKEDRELLITKVNIIFHVAASVRFDDPLYTSATVNMRATIEVIEMAKEMKNLYAFVHVSTAYANAKWENIEEKMYPPYADWRDTLNVCESIDEGTIRCLTPKLLGELPNTYVFTKQLAEHIVYEQKGSLPIVITRPSIVISSISEPMPGWIENFNGPVGIIVAVGIGILRCLYTSKDFSPDYIAVDSCIKHFITAAWIRGTKPMEPSDDIEIYNCCSKKRMPNKLILEYGKEICSQTPLENALWTLECNLTTSKYIYYITIFFSQILPALFMDMMLFLKGKKPMMLKLQRKIFGSNIIVQNFLLCEWMFTVDNLITLNKSLKEDDLHDFYYDSDQFLTKKHFVDSIWGGRRYLLKEKDENLPRASTRIKRIILLDKILRYSTYALVGWLVIKYDVLVSLYQKFI